MHIFMRDWWMLLYFIPNNYTVRYYVHKHKYIKENVYTVFKNSTGTNIN